MDEGGCPVVTARLWRAADAPSWERGPDHLLRGPPDPDGSHQFFELILDPTLKAFQSFAEDYYEASADIEALRHVFSLRLLELPQITNSTPGGLSGARDAESDRGMFLVDTAEGSGSASRGWGGGAVHEVAGRSVIGVSRVESMALKRTKG